MSARFWLFALTMTGAASLGGLGLGFYATTIPHSAATDAISPDVTPVFGQENVSYAGYPVQAGESGPTVIHCEGCGPTLSERRLAADMAGWDSYDDPMVQEYMRDDPAVTRTLRDMGEQARPQPTVQHFPPQVEPEIPGPELSGAEIPGFTRWAIVEPVGSTMAEPAGSY